MRKFCSLFPVVLLSAACVGEITEPDPHDDSKAQSAILEGDALADELAASPVREAVVPFRRVGVIWDAPNGGSFELSTSDDGQTWSEWAAPLVLDHEAEMVTTYVGEYTVPAEDPALYYRIRAAGDDAPSFVAMEFLELSLSDSIEGGEMEPEPVDEPDGIARTAQALSVGGTYVNSRGSWGARSPKCVSYHSPRRITIHHTVTPTNDSMSPKARLRQIQSYHQNVRGWCDIGYQYLMSRDGRLWEGRGANRLGAHVAGANTGNVAISFMGTYTSTNPTNKQLNRAAALVRGLHNKYGIPITSSRIKGHRDFGGTACPGNRLYAKLGAIRSRARDGGDTSPPPPSGTTVKGLVYKGSNTSARISGATVKLGTRTTTTNASGYYEFKNVSSGNKTIRASKSGFTTRSITRHVSGSETWGSIGLPRSGPTGTAVLQGVVYRTSDSSNRIPNATVKLIGPKTVTRTADGNGFYRVTSLPPGTYTIRASKTGYTTRSVTRTISNGTTTWGSVRL